MTGDETDRNRQVVSLILGRLAAPGSAGKTWRDASIADGEQILDVAQDWQQAGAHAVMWEMGGSLYGAGRDRAFEVAGRMAAVGEQLGLAHAAAVEGFFWMQSLETAPEKAAGRMGWRAMTELMTHYLLGASHGFLNVAVRVLGFDTKLRQRAEKVFGMSLTPFSEERSDSPSFSRRTTEQLAGIARRHSNEAVVTLVEPLTKLAAGLEWRALEEARGKDFHRWRPQSLATLSQRSPWSQSGNTWTMGFPTRGAPDVDALARERGIVSEAYMVKLAESMEAFGSRFSAASSILGGPRFKVDGDG